MDKHVIAASAFLISLPVWAADDASAVVAQSEPQAAASACDLQRALQEIEELKSRITVLEANQKAPAPPVQYTPAAPSRAKDHNLELYGFVQLDAIQDFDRVNQNWDATLRPSRIPTQEGQFGSDGQSIFSVRQSRLGAKANGMLAGKPYEAKFEFDLFGVGADEGQTTFRLRQAYASWGPFLAGQTNSLFMDGDLFPNTIDYWGPTGMVFLRNPQIRFTFLNSNGWKAAVALENPGNDIDPGGIRLIDESLSANIRGDEELPDLTGQIRYDGKWGHVQLSGILRKVGYDTVGTEDNEPEGSETGWGVNLGTSFNVALATFRVGVAHGRGIASYMNDGGMDLAPSASLVPAPPPVPFNLLLEADAVKLLGVTSYVDLQWSKIFSSSVGYSFTRVKNTNFQDPTAFHKGEYASANLIWTPARQIMTGAELLWGKRTDNDGETGTDTRLQYSFKWSFTSQNIWDVVE